MILWNCCCWCLADGDVLEFQDGIRSIYSSPRRSAYLIVYHRTSAPSRTWYALRAVIFVFFVRNCIFSQLEGLPRVIPLPGHSHICVFWTRPAIQILKIYSLPIPTTHRTGVMAGCLCACLRDHPSHTLSKTHKGLREAINISRRHPKVKYERRMQFYQVWCSSFPLCAA